jgi:hypothetical protein
MESMYLTPFQRSFLLAKNSETDFITLEEIAKTLGVPRGRVKEYFGRGKYLEFVPRPLDPNAQWRIYRKDFDVALARKVRQLSQEHEAWDEVFQLDALCMD